MNGRSLPSGFDRRQSVQDQIAFYRQQLELSRRGITERPPEFYERQIMFLEIYSR